MRKYLFAGAVAGGLLLLSGAPAQADDQPAPAGVLGGLLNPAGGVDPTGGLDLDSPLGGHLVNVKPGQNSPDLTGAAGNALPASNGRPAARTGLGDQSTNRTPSGSVAGGTAKPALPAADVVNEALPAPGGLPALGSLPAGNLLGGGLPLIGGLMPDGRTPAAFPAARESRLLGDDLPLLGGLGGLLPVDSARTLPASDVSGMPAGGIPVTADDTTTPTVDEPAADPADPADAGPGDDDKRLHEEPIDNEAKQSKRSFSDGRPVAAEDTEYE
jgi:hypothetical protein